MPKELYKLYKTYNKEEIDNNFIEIAFELLLKEDKELVNKYINNLIIEETNKNYLGTYNNETRDVTINKQKIMEESKKNSFKKILTIQTLRHEIEHARNLKMLYDGKKDIHSTVTGYSLREHAITNGLLPPTKNGVVDLIALYWRKINNYEIDTGERVAEIKSWKYMVNLLKNQRNTDDILLARSMLYYSYIRGYEDNGYYLNAPTYEYLLKLKLYKDYEALKERVEKNNYSLETRLMNGLPLRYKEFEKETLKKTKLRRIKKQ